MKSVFVQASIAVAFGLGIGLIANAIFTKFGDSTILSAIGNALAPLVGGLIAAPFIARSKAPILTCCAIAFPCTFTLMVLERGGSNFVGALETWLVIGIPVYTLLPFLVVLLVSQTLVRRVKE